MSNFGKQRNQILNLSHVIFLELWHFEPSLSTILSSYKNVSSREKHSLTLGENKRPVIVTPIQIGIHQRYVFWGMGGVTHPQIFLNCKKVSQEVSHAARELAQCFL